MFRYFLFVSLVSATSVAASSDCEVFGEIANQAAAERKADTEMMDAMVKIAEGFTGDQTRFGAAVPLIVDHVWNLDASELDKDVGAAWRTQCEAQ